MFYFIFIVVLKNVRDVSTLQINPRVYFKIYYIILLIYQRVILNKL